MIGTVPEFAGRLAGQLLEIFAKHTGLPI